MKQTVPILLLVAIVVCITTMGCGLANSAADNDGARESGRADCRVGGNPAMNLSRVPQGSREELRSRIFVIGCGTGPGDAGPVEIVGYRTSQGFCYGVDMPKLGRSEGGLCLPSSADWMSVCGKEHVCANGAIAFSAKGQRLTQTSGQFDPRVENLSMQQADAHSTVVVARPSGDLKRKLGIRSPISFFAAMVQGCSASGIDLEWIEGEKRSQLTVNRIAPEGCRG